MAKTRTVPGRSRRLRRVTASMPTLTRREVEFVKALFRELSTPGLLSSRIEAAIEKRKRDRSTDVDD
jgi:hypothetical protein